jgi:hypothetical protein
MRGDLAGCIDLSLTLAYFEPDLTYFGLTCP